MPTTQPKTCLVSCSVLKKEINQLIKQHKLNAEPIYVSKYFHIDYAEIEKNLRRVLEKTLQKHPNNVVLVYGDLCLGPNNEMKQLTQEYGITKIDALNCVDCQLGGKGKSQEADPNHDLMFLSPGMTDFFNHMKTQMHKENIPEDQLKQLFTELRGIILLDTLGNPKQLRGEVEKVDTGIPIIETRHVGLENVKNVINEAINKNKKQK
jgi:accessory colonization factor AcfC